MGFKVGEKSKAVCYQCEKVVKTTFQKRLIPDLPRKHAEETKLVSVCDECDSVVGIVIPPARKGKGK